MFSGPHYFWGQEYHTVCISPAQHLHKISDPHSAHKCDKYLRNLFPMQCFPGGAAQLLSRDIPANYI